MKKKKVALVTGIAGFIGSNIAERLLSLGYDLIGVDNLSTGKLSNLPVSKSIKMYTGDIADRNFIEKVFKKEKIDIVFHLAGNASIVSASANPTSDVSNNLITTINIVDLCIKYKIPRLLHASTMVVYGAQNVHKKETDCCVPTSTYGLTKYAGERYVMNAGARSDLSFNFNVSAFRMFNVFGPKQDLDNPYQGVIAIFIGNALKDRVTTIHGSGKQTRDFIYIDDVVNAWIMSIENKDTFNQVMNLGSGNDHSINEILKMVQKHINPQMKVQRENLRQGDISRCVANNSKIKKILKWKPSNTLDAGFDKLIHFTRIKK